MSTEIKITPLAIMKKHKNGSSLVSIGPREKVWFNEPLQFWVKESICVDKIKISPLAIKKKHQNGSNLVSIGPREKVRINNPPQFWVKESICVDVIKITPLGQKSKLHLRPLWKSTKMVLA